jgi:hypothetical protein
VGGWVGGSVGKDVNVGADVGTAVGSRVGEDVTVGISVGFGQISSSVAEQDEALALHAVAPQHAKGVGAVQAAHDEVSLRSAGPAH